MGTRRQFFVLALAWSACARGAPSLEERLIGKWQCEQREIVFDSRPPSPRQTTWKGPCTMEFFPNGTSVYVEDGVTERGRFTIVEKEHSLIESVTESDVKERVGSRARSIVTIAGSRLTLAYDPDSGGRRTTLTFIRK